ncbi:MAG: flagellar hook-length control protein FliK, partial [Lachnospiraceae bacterium]|nr:flagellar hook-length control protein FliK [Lachnospiraceae bacterium]
ISGKDIIKLAKDVLGEMSKEQPRFPEEVKEKLTKLLASKEFGSLVKDTLSKQMLLKPEEVVSSKNIEELYSKITKQANQAVELMQTLSKDNPEIASAAKNINDNVAFMNELNQVATYVQLPLLMNNKSAHGDLYVYTKKKNLKDNDGDISALLHLDMENLGPMDVYVQLINKVNLKTHFYMQDEATIDFIEAHIGALNKRLTEKGYNMDLNISVKDKAKGPTNIADEMLKNDPLEEGISASKFSFDVRA